MSRAIANSNKTVPGDGMDVKSELEGAILGVVSVEGPSTPYAVLTVFARSRSSYWSASTGAVYPAIRRLLRRGLLTATKRSRGTRQSSLCALTARGRKALVRWVGPPWDWRLEAATFDPLRTRISFLGAISPAKRLKYLKEAEGRTAAELRPYLELVRTQREGGDLWEAFASLGALEQLRARLRWLRSLSRELRRGPGRKRRRRTRA
jgi:DNA-binding PadR family transcriptional regulator